MKTCTSGRISQPLARWRQLQMASTLFSSWEENKYLGINMIDYKQGETSRRCHTCFLSTAERKRKGQLLYPGHVILSLILTNRTCQDAARNWVNVSGESWKRLVKCFVFTSSWFVCFLVWCLWEVYRRFHSSESQFPTSFGQGVEQTIRGKWFSQTQCLSPFPPLPLSTSLSSTSI